MQQLSTTLGGATSARPVDPCAWLSGLFVPRWIERTCLPGKRGYVEDVFLPDGAPLPSDRYSTLVTARLAYTFSLAHRLDGARASLEAAERGLELLLGTCRLSPGRYAHLVGEDGKVIDPRGDLYELAFVLLALGGYACAGGSRDVTPEIDAIAGRLDGDLADAAGGYREPGGDGGRRRQFPQMHLFEAFQCLAPLLPGGGWGERAEALLALAERLVGEDGAIDEWYATDWRPLDDAAARGRELGHQFEWARLLYDHAATQDCARAARLADRLYHSAIAAAGIGEGGLRAPLPNALDAAGAPMPGARPFWPTTELLGAAAAAARLGRADAGRMGQAALDCIFTHWMDAATGLWCNERDPRWRPLSNVLPVRVLYHIVPNLMSHPSRTG